MTVKEQIDNLICLASDNGLSGEFDEGLLRIGQHIVGLETSIALMRGQIEGLRVKCGEQTPEDGIKYLIESGGGNFHAEGADFVDEDGVA